MNIDIFTTTGRYRDGRRVIYFRRRIRHSRTGRMWVHVEIGPLATDVMWHPRRKDS